MDPASSKGMKNTLKYIKFLMLFGLLSMVACSGGVGGCGATTSDVTSDDVTESSEGNAQPVSIPVTIAKDDEIDGTDPSSYYLSQSITGNQQQIFGPLVGDAIASSEVNLHGSVLGDEEKKVGVIVGDEVVEVLDTTNQSFTIDISDYMDKSMAFIVYAGNTDDYDVGPASNAVYVTPYNDPLADEAKIAVSLSDEDSTPDIEEKRLAVSYDSNIAFVSQDISDDVYLSTIAVSGGASTLLTSEDNDYEKLQYDLDGNLYAIDGDTQLLYQITSEGDVNAVGPTENLPSDRRYAIHPRGRYIMTTVVASNSVTGGLTNALYLIDLEDESQSRMLDNPDEENFNIDHIDAVWASNTHIQIIRAYTDGFDTSLYDVALNLSELSDTLNEAEWTATSTSYIGNLASDQGVQSQVVFECTIDDRINVCNHNDSNNEVEIVYSGEYEISAMSYSHDGRYLIAQMDVEVDGTDINEIVMWDTDSDEISYLAQGMLPTFVPQENLIVYLNDKLGSTQIGIINIEYDIDDSESIALSILPAEIGITTGSGYSFIAQGGNLPYSFSLAEGNGSVHLQSGYFIADEAVGAATVRVTDVDGNYVDTTIAIGDAMELSTASLVVIKNQSMQIDVAGGFEPYTYEVIAGGGSISTDGLYTAPGGQDSVIIEVTDAYGNSSTVELDVGDVNGVVDQSYGSSGQTQEIKFGDYIVSMPTDAVILEDDSVIVVGGSTNDGSSFVSGLAKVLPDGNLDLDFGEDGIVVIEEATGDNMIQAVDIDTNGNIVVCGNVSYGEGERDAFVYRLDAEGSFDSSFSGDGKHIFAFANSDDNGCNDVITMPNGKILVAGELHTGGHTDFALQRLNNNGDTDMTFGLNGLFQLDFSNEHDSITSIVVTAGGIVMAGYATDGGTKDFALAKVDFTGSLDEDFGANGLSVLNASGPLMNNDEINHMTVTGDGAILVSGQINDGSQVFAVARFLSNGAPDMGFGGTGLLVLPTGTGNSFSFGVAVDNSQRIYAVGDAIFDDGDAISYRIHPNGDIDNAFANMGLLNVDLAMSDRFTRALFMSDGRVVFVGMGATYDLDVITGGGIHLVRIWP
jgi:uncharacterized delta-60 repeat protein